MANSRNFRVYRSYRGKTLQGTGDGTGGAEGGGGEGGENVLGISGTIYFGVAKCNNLAPQPKYWGGQLPLCPTNSVARALESFIKIVM